MEQEQEQVRQTIDKVKKYWKDNKVLLIIIIVLFLITAGVIIKWSTDTSKLELENQLIEAERVLIEKDIEALEKGLDKLKQEKSSLYDTIDKYKQEKRDILNQRAQDRRKFTSDIEKVKKETLSQDQEWWDEQGKKLIKKWNLQ